MCRHGGVCARKPWGDLSRGSGCDSEVTAQHLSTPHSEAGLARAWSPLPGPQGAAPLSRCSRVAARRVSRASPAAVEGVGKRLLAAQRQSR